MRTIVAFDLDGVLYDLLGGLFAAIYKKHGVHLDPCGIRQYSLAGLTDDDDVNRSIVETIRDARLYFQLKPLPGAVDAIHRLRARRASTVIALTGRPLHTRSATLVALGRDFGAVFDQVIVTPTKKKVTTAARLRVKHMVEDHGPTAQDMAKRKVNVWLVDRPYNGGDVGRRVTRVRDVGEAVDGILSRLNLGAEV